MALGDRLRAMFSKASSRRFDEPGRVRFSGQIPQLLSEFAARRGGRASRDEALTVPAVLRGRNLICAIGTLPLEAVDAGNELVDHALLRQPDTNIPRSVSMAMTVEDLLFDAVAWWRVTGFGWDGYPVNAVRYEPGQVSLKPPPGFDMNLLPSGLTAEGVVWMAGEPVPHSEVIRFDSPNPAVLVAGRRAIVRSLALDDAAQLFAQNPRLRGYFAPRDPTVDPGDDDVIQKALEEWEDNRRNHVDGYVPAALVYNTVQDPTPADLQLIQLQEKVVKDLANVLGIDPEELAVSTTTRTYANIVDRRKDRVNDTLAPYMVAITDRLSMPDVTKRGVRVRFNLDDYLKADPKTRAEVQQMYVSMGATDAAEVRSEEGKPAREIEPPAPAAAPIPATVGEPLQITASRPAPHTFAGASVGMTFDLDADATFAVDGARRTITGLAVPYGQAARSRGRRFRFARGSIRYSAVNRIKLLRDHDTTHALGVATRLDDTEQGLVATFRVSPGVRGDEALALAADGVLDGLSIGVEFREEDTEPDPEHPGATLVRRTALREVSLTAVPSFDDSRLTAINAAYEGVDMHTCPTCGAQISEGVAHTCTPAPATGPATSPAGAGQSVTFSAEQFEAFMGRLSPAPAPAQAAPERPTVSPARPVASAVVTEPLPYRFSRQGGRHVFSPDAPNDFSTDLFAVIRAGVGDGGSGVEAGAARTRLDAMIGAAFANRSTTAMFADVESADVTALNPNRHRGDMWQPQRDYVTPLWDMVDSGNTDGTKFDVPKFTSSSGLVGPATEKTEPAGGAMVVELQTITPTQVWGKVEVTRQSWRAGGNPALSGILWDQMLREYYEDREAAVSAFLATLTAATDITLTGRPALTPDNDDDQVTVGDFAAAQADLQFVRGGNRFRAFAVHQDLYRVFSRVTDDMGRPLYPILAPSNANGTTAPLYRTIDVNGTTAVPAWALAPAAGGTAAVNSWLFDPSVVRGWASAPERMFWDFGATVQTANIPQLSFVTLGIYGDVAFANIDISGVRQVIFDPSV